MQKLSEITISGILPETADKIEEFLKQFCINWERCDYPEKPEHEEEAMITMKQVFGGKIPDIPPDVEELILEEGLEKSRRT